MIFAEESYRLPVEPGVSSIADRPVHTCGKSVKTQRSMCTADSSLLLAASGGSLNIPDKTFPNFNFYRELEVMALQSITGHS